MSDASASSWTDGRPPIAGDRHDHRLGGRFGCIYPTRIAVIAGYLPHDRVMLKGRSVGLNFGGLADGGTQTFDDDLAAGANAPRTNLLRSADGLGYAIHHHANLT